MTSSPAWVVGHVIKTGWGVMTWKIADKHFTSDELLLPKHPDEHFWIPADIDWRWQLSFLFDYIYNFSMVDCQEFHKDKYWNLCIDCEQTFDLYCWRPRNFIYLEFRDCFVHKNIKIFLHAEAWIAMNMTYLAQGLHSFYQTDLQQSSIVSVYYMVTELKFCILYQISKSW